MAVRPKSPTTWTGTFDGEVYEFPNSPELLLPQARAVPSRSNAAEWLPPAAIAIASEIPSTLVGTLESVPTPLVPIPSCPSEFSPHDQTDPSARRASE